MWSGIAQPSHQSGSLCKVSLPSREPTAPPSLIHTAVIGTDLDLGPSGPVATAALLTAWLVGSAAHQPRGDVSHRAVP